MTIAMTTSNSISVNAREMCLDFTAGANIFIWNNAPDKHGVSPETRRIHGVFAACSNRVKKVRHQ